MVAVGDLSTRLVIIVYMGVSVTVEFRYYLKSTVKHLSLAFEKLWKNVQKSK